MTTFKIYVNPFYIKADNEDNAIDIMWEKFGVEFSQIDKIRLTDDNIPADNE